jgi:ABC-type lipoprotein export system ATPase subunit
MSQQHQPNIEATSPSKTNQNKNSSIPSSANSSSLSASLRISSTRMFSPTRPSWPRRLSEVPRRTHMDALIAARRESIKMLFSTEDETSSEIISDAMEEGSKQQQQRQSKQILEQNSEFVRKIHSMMKDNKDNNHVLSSRRCPVEIRLLNLTYRVPRRDRETVPKISTIYNSSPLYKCVKFLQSFQSDEKKKKAEWTNVLTNVNLVLKPKKMYLVLGPPLCGKTSLLKAIAGMISCQQGEVLDGSILYNNLNVLTDGKHGDLFKNLVAFVRQNDNHAARLTVDETFTFAANCKGSAQSSHRVEMTLEALGLMYVKDTFVGDENVRGVSGGQRRRVTLGEVRL